MEILLCLVPLVLSGLTLGLGIAYRNRGKQLRTLREQSEEQLQTLKEQSEKQVQSLQERIRALNEHIRELREENERVAREEWFKDIMEIPYRNEIEVEVKFILPLVKFLGYHESDLDLRVPVGLQMGSQSIRGEADWVLWDRGTDPTNPSALVVIEAKAPTHALDEVAQAQARSYAFGLNAPTYALANGQRLQIFRRGVQSDTCIVDCAMDGLAALWPAIYQAMGAKPGTQHDASLRATEGIFCKI